MEHCVEVSNRCVAQVSSLTYVYDIREWIHPHLDDIQYHTQPHIFLFKRNPVSGRSEMFYKYWSHSPCRGVSRICVRGVLHSDRISAREARAKF